jgi:hypothetical protein
VLKFDLNLSRKVLSKAAQDALPTEIRVFRDKLLPLYSFAKQLVIQDGTSKDAYRWYEWSKRDTKAVVKLPFW